MFWRTFPDVFAHPIISSNASIEIFLADLADHNGDARYFSHPNRAKRINDPFFYRL